MKKSQLRNIIKESIKELMIEQTNPNARFVQTLYCDGSHESLTQTQDCSTLYPNVPHFANAPQGTQCAGVMNASFFHNMTINGQIPQLGDTFNFNLQLNGITGFNGGINHINSNPGFFDSWVGDHVVVNVAAGQPQNGQTDYSSGAACPAWPSTSSGCPGCNGGNHTWGNMQNWMNNFNNNIINAPWFSQPNQPCQFLNNRITQWTAQQAGITNQCNAYWNQLECKKKHVDATLKPQYNC